MKVEELLNSYHELKVKIELLEIDIADCISLGSKNTDDPLPGKMSVRSNTSVVERQAANIEDMQAELRMYKRLIEKIDIVVNNLDAEDRELIRLRYFEHVPVSILSLKYHITVQGVYERLKNTLKRFEKYFNYILK